MKTKLLWLVCIAAFELFLLFARSVSQLIRAEGGNVKLLRVPNQGIQPQATLDGRGDLHLIYFAGDPQAGDLYYVRRPGGMTMFTSPIRVNSEPGSAIATGSIRGAHLAVGKGGR